MGSEVMRLSASGDSFGQSITAGLYGLCVSNSMRQNSWLVTHSPVGLIDGGVGHQTVSRAFKHCGLPIKL